MVLAIVGLSSCAGYTSAAKTSTGDPGAGVLSASATSLSFGSVAVGNASHAKLVGYEHGNRNGHHLAGDHDGRRIQRDRRKSIRLDCGGPEQHDSNSICADSRRGQ